MKGWCVRPGKRRGVDHAGRAGRTLRLKARPGIRIQRVVIVETESVQRADAGVERDAREISVAPLGPHVLRGLRRAEIVALDVGDVAPGLSLRRVQGKGGTEVAVPLPAVAQKILGDYIAMVRTKAAATEPLGVVPPAASPSGLGQAQPVSELQTRIMAALEEQKRSDQWRPRRDHASGEVADCPAVERRAVQRTEDRAVTGTPGPGAVRPPQRHPRFAEAG